MLFRFCRVVDDIWTVEDILVFSFANELSMTSWLGTGKIPREQILVEEFNFTWIEEKQRKHARKNRVCSFNPLLFTLLFLEFVPFFVCSSVPLVLLENSVTSFVPLFVSVISGGILARKCNKTPLIQLPGVQPNRIFAADWNPFFWFPFYGYRKPPGS